jgi:hypothetical protein
VHVEGCCLWIREIMTSDVAEFQCFFEVKILPFFSKKKKENSDIPLFFPI